MVREHVSRSMQDLSWLRSLVWVDYRLAVIFAVICPLALLIWATVRRVPTIQRLLIIYWRVASLLAVTVYLMAASFPIAFIAAFLAHLLIPISLWFWIDLNEEINDQPQRPLTLGLSSWRWATTIYFGLGAVIQIPFLQCAFRSRTDVMKAPLCEVWLEPSWKFANWAHATSTGPFLGFLGIVGLVIYVLYLGHFILFRFPKQGRLALDD
jgi:hypothetical protein